MPSKLMASTAPSRFLPLNTRSRLNYRGTSCVSEENLPFRSHVLRDGTRGSTLLGAEKTYVVDADSDRCRPLFRDDVAHHSGMISPGVGRLCWPTQVRSFGLQRRTGCQQRGRPCATCAKFCGCSWCEAVC